MFLCLYVFLCLNVFVFCLFLIICLFLYIPMFQPQVIPSFFFLTCLILNANPSQYLFLFLPPHLLFFCLYVFLFLSLSLFLISFCVCCFCLCFLACCFAFVSFSVVLSLFLIFFSFSYFFDVPLFCCDFSIFWVKVFHTICPTKPKKQKLKSNWGRQVHWDILDLVSDRCFMLPIKLSNHTEKWSNFIFLKNCMLFLPASYLLVLVIFCFVFCFYSREQFYKGYFFFAGSLKTKCTLLVHIYSYYYDSPTDAFSLVLRIRI